MDVFERIRQLISPTNVKPQTPIGTNAQRGIETVNQIRGSLNIPAPKPITPDFNLSTYSQFTPKPPVIQSRFEPTPLKAVAPQLNIKPEPQMSVMPKIKPQEVMSVKPQPLKAVPFQTFTPRVPEAETPFGRYIVSKAVVPLDTGIKKISNAWSNPDKKSGFSRALEGVEGVGLLAGIPNELFIQPLPDTIKLGIRGLVTGKITQDDVNEFLFTSGGQKGTIFKAFDTDEYSFGKKYGNVALQTARFLDFAPELINIPVAQGGKIGKTQTFASEFKLTGEGIKETAPKLSKAQQLQNAIKNFETKIGQTLSKETKREIQKATDNFNGFINKISSNLETSRRVEQIERSGVASDLLNRLKQAEEELVKRTPTQSFTEQSKELKGVGMEYSAINRWIQKTPTDTELANEAKKLNSLYSGREVIYKGTPAVVQKTPFGKVTIKTADEKVLTVEKEAITVPQVTREQVIDSLYNKGIKTLEGKNRIYNLPTETPTPTVTPAVTPSVTAEAPKIVTTTPEQIKASIRQGIPNAQTSNFATLGKQVITNAQKERRFAKTTVAGAERTAEETKRILNNSNDIYTPLNNKSAFAQAENFVNSNTVQDVLNKIRNSQDPRDVSYIGQALMNKFQKIGDYNGEAQVALEISQKATEFGQAIQALSIWKKLTPTGAKVWAQKEIAKANEVLGLKEGDKGFITLTEQKLKEIGEQAAKISKTTDAYQKDVETALLYKLIYSDIPSELLSKIGTYQTIAQLLNTKTLIRNVAGNLIFGTLEAVSNGVATVLDAAVGLYTKKRGVANLNPVGYAKGFVSGFKKGVNESLLGIDTMNASALNSSVQNGFIFQSKIMQGFEKALNLTLKPFDRAFYEANYRATLEGLMKANKTDVPTQEMIEQAHYMGLYRTFQDENVATKAFSLIKKAFNVGYDTKTKKIIVNPFGLGDFILKYSKVPANLLMRAVDYSPLGYVKAVFELSQPLFKKEFNQADFVNAISRATVGSVGLINTGYILGKLGIITPKPDSKKDVRNAQQLDGVRGYAFNVSALKRYVASGFDPEAAKKMEGDELFSYDWAQPLSITLAMGANWAETEKLKKNSAQERLFASFGAGSVAFADAMNTLTDQPVLQGLQTLFSSQGLVQGFIDVVKSAPASFVPTVLNQINQLTDNTRRETYDPNILEESKNIAIAKVPFLSTSLPPRYDILGKPSERYQGGTNTFVNVMLNPAFVSKIGSDEALKEVIRLYESTDETSVIPNSVDKKVKINKEDVLLTGQQMSDYQKEIGTKSDELIRKMLSNEDYYKLPDDVKASLLAKGLSNINSATKINMFGDRPKEISFDVNLLQNNQIDNYIYKNITDAILDQPKKEMSVKTDQLEVLLKGQRNPQEISKFIIDNKIPQSSISSVISKIKKDEVYSKLPAELQKYNGLSNSQLEELKTLKPNLSTDIIRYQQFSKTYDNIANAQIGFYKALGTKKPSLKGGIKKPKKGRKLAGLKPKKPSKLSLKPKAKSAFKESKLAKVKLPKIKKTTKLA